MNLRIPAAVLALALAAPPAATAQVAWDSPMLAAPVNPTGLGVFLVDVAGGDLGVMGTYRGSPGGLGLRLGIAEDFADEIAVFGGVETQGLLVRARGDFPLDAAWVAGVGASVGDDVWVTVPLGVTLGRTLSGDGVMFTPYVTPRLVLDAFFGDLEDELELDVAVDLGVDVGFSPEWTVRVGGTLGDREAVAIGLVF